MKYNFYTFYFCFAICDQIFTILGIFITKKMKDDRSINSE